MTEEEMGQALQAGKEAMAKARAEEAKRIMEAGEKFLAANKNKKGVVELPSGLQYVVLKEGKGASPKAEDTVSVHYRGTFLDGKEFDSSYAHGDKPVSFNLNGVIAGFREALILMRPGAKWRIFVPSDLAYGPKGAPPAIGPNETLIFEIELLSVNAG
jgi:FKBP-type peptidyl-prolyl cis-trans isomerase